ncbi:MvaI/BcnI restriction endonuclease family protein [Faecalibacter macacae]|uniref:MvaI/BcnI restriction endonuclease family protein n=1 Tax=Faecalibacter macacae TaxID=1859289 RepID=A0A3L9LZW3_9FLAO|nr:MvaI/BcnI restriction endonuclease family protein [Faecalibacter macacae]RLZ06447.1 MvaI/BcnI restriction endonuclease family protein [Faecalibacter macacae]
MRPLTTIELTRLQLLTENSVEFTLIEPTETALKKSIMDATGSVRIYLKNQNVHDYDLQGKGASTNGVSKQTKIILENTLVDTTTSLYRPETKDGDPRIWVYKLKPYANANDILAIINFQEVLYIVNVTQLDFDSLIKGEGNNPLKELVAQINSDSNEVADELLGLLRDIAKRGFVPGLLQADTSIGRTLETLLGIEINSSRKPDYKGIELKSFRDSRTNRKTLFAQVPDWSASKFKSSAEILDNFGYERGDDFKLYCTVSAITRNSQGLKLNMQSDIRYLFENSERATIGDFVAWSTETLHKRLLEKHNETFWIAADTQLIDNVEHFQFKKVEHTKKPIVSQFDILIEQGIITLDHLIKRNSAGRVVEKGPLFKIKPNALNLLFPPSEIYDLI